MRRRIHRLVDKSGVQRGSGLDIAREGYRVTVTMSITHTHKNVGHSPHKPRCELSRGCHLFTELVGRNGCLERSNYARRNQPHVCIRKSLSWTFPEGCEIKVRRHFNYYLPPPKAENEVLRICLPTF
jgi:hypothetical protein